MRHPDPGIIMAISPTSAVFSDTHHYERECKALHGGAWAPRLTKHPRPLLQPEAYNNST